MKMAADIKRLTIVTILCDGAGRYASKMYNPDFLKSKACRFRPGWTLIPCAGKTNHDERPLRPDFPADLKRACRPGTDPIGQRPSTCPTRTRTPAPCLSRRIFPVRNSSTSTLSAHRPTCPTRQRRKSLPPPWAPWGSPQTTPWWSTTRRYVQRTARLVDLPPVRPRRVLVLNGGLPAWRQRVTAQPTRRPGPSRSLRGPRATNGLADKDDVGAALAAGHGVADARPGVFTGADKEPAPACASHMPGAVGAPLSSLWIRTDSFWRLKSWQMPSPWSTPAPR